MKPNSQIHPSRLLRTFDGLPQWWLASAGVQADARVRVGRTTWLVCYKVHIVPGHRKDYRASITLWPSVRTRLKSRQIAGWNADLKQSGWYERTAREVRRHGYRGAWQWSPWGRLGDFSKKLRNLADLKAEVIRLEHLRTTIRFE